MRPEQTTGELLKRLALPAAFVALLFWALWDRAEPRGDDGGEVAEDAGTAGDSAVGEGDGGVSDASTGADDAGAGFERRGETMGTTFHVKVVGNADADAVDQAIATTLAEIDALMSTWRPDSELSRLNASGTEPFPVSKPTAEVLRLAGSIHAATGGAFDVTVGPLVRRWGFGPDGAQAAPSEDEIAALVGRVGFDKLVLDGATVRKERADVDVDLSAIAKGYGVDRVAEAVDAVDGVDAVMVEIGGEVRVIGLNGARPWRLAIERPDAQRRAVHSVVELQSGALATSGDYRRFLDEDGARRTHVVDPRTGRPVEHGVASASVLAPDCATADAWATALMVLPPDEGLAIVRETDGLQAMVIVRGAEGMDVLTTDGFEAALVGGEGRGRP